jgi:hypothetical protein
VFPGWRAGRERGKVGQWETRAEAVDLTDLVAHDIANAGAIGNIHPNFDLVRKIGTVMEHRKDVVTPFLPMASHLRRSRVRYGGGTVDSHVTLLRPVIGVTT